MCTKQRSHDQRGREGEGAAAERQMKEPAEKKKQETKRKVRGTPKTKAAAAPEKIAT